MSEEFRCAFCGEVTQINHRKDCIAGKTIAVKYSVDESKLTETKPYCCPVCAGNGLVPGGFYTGTGKTRSSSCSMETCRTCQGKGVIWKNFGG